MNTTRRRLAMGVIAVSVLLSAAGAKGADTAPVFPAVPPPGSIQISGSSTLSPLIAELAKNFMQSHPGTTISVTSSGSDLGIADLRAGKADIAMISRKLEAEEHDLYAIPVALDGVNVIVHRDNPVGTVTRSQLMDIYRGKISDWSVVGGKEARIDVVSLKGTQGAHHLIADFLGIRPSESPAARIVASNDEMRDAISASLAAIGFKSIGKTEMDIREGYPIKALKIDGVVLNAESVRDGTGPMSRRLNLVTRDVPKGDVKAFIAYAISPETSDVVRAHAFVPIH